MGDVFRRYATYYDLIYEDKDYIKECNYIEDIIKKFSGKVMPRTILDSGCGTGGHALLLAKRNYIVEGIDASKEMIEIAKEKAARSSVNINFRVMSMQDLGFKKKFDSAICMFSAIDYLLTIDDLQKFLGGVRRHLKKGALFIFDFWNGAAAIKHYSPLKVKKIKRKDKKIIRTSKTKLNAITQICEVVFDCTVIGNGRVIDQFEEKHVVRFLMPEEIKHYLSDNGFDTVAMYPFLSLKGKISDKTWDITAIARAK